MSDVTLPRLLTRAEAAAHCAMSVTGFTTWVREKIVPGPLPGTTRYDRIALDRAIDKLSGFDAAPVIVEQPETPSEKWNREYDEKRARRRQGDSGKKG